jgi:septal ring factor EnvC (AmiA/AmiB activator)
MAKSTQQSAELFDADAYAEELKALQEKHFAGVRAKITELQAQHREIDEQIIKLQAQRREIDQQLHALNSAESTITGRGGISATIARVVFGKLKALRPPETPPHIADSSMKDIPFTAPGLG